MPRRQPSLARQCAERGVQRAYDDAWGHRQVADERVLRAILDALGPAREGLARRTKPPNAPARAWIPEALAGARRAWGISVQLYSLRSRRNWGIGDFADLDPLIDWCGANGADVLGLSPLHALFAHDPARISPYSPCSRRFLNALYIAVDQVEDFSAGAAARRLAADPAFRRELRRLRAAPLVDYHGVAALKARAFAAMYQHFRTQHLARSSERARRFRRFQASSGAALRRHALFEALQARFHKEDPAVWGWQVWPEPFRNPASAAVREFAHSHLERVEYFEYLQWLAAEQLQQATGKALAAGLSVGLYLDVAIGADRSGSDVWSDQALYAHQASIGAPPDRYNLLGQDWGLPPMRPDRLEAANFEPVAGTLRAVMAGVGMLRIDHVMGLKRLWWIAPGFKPAEGAYVQYPFEQLLDALVLESHRGRCMVVGEDLGTVPPLVRRAMAKRGVLSMKLPWFESDARGRPLRPEAYPRDALVAASTHDLPTIAGWWAGRDLRVRAQIGLIESRALLREQLAARARERERMCRALAAIGPAPRGPATFADALHACIAATPCRVALLQVEDLLGLADQANLPGTVDEHPNWRRRLPADAVAQLQGARVRRIVARVRALRGSPSAAAAR